MKWTVFLIMLLCFISEGFSATIYRQVDFLLSGYRNPVTDEPLEGGKVYVYQSGGMLTPETLYQDRDGNTPHPNPIVLSTYGKAEAYGNGVYRFVIKTSEDVSVETIDGYECYAVSADATTGIVDSIEDIEAELDTLDETYLELDGTNSPMIGALAMGTNKITGLATPTAGTDAVTKTYADGYLAGLVITAEAWADGDLVQYEATGTYFRKVNYDDLIGISGEAPLVKFDSGNNAHGETASVSYAGYTTRFFMTKFTIAQIGATGEALDYLYNVDVGINTTTGAVTCIFPTVEGGGASSALTGTVYWTAISVKQ